MGRHSRTIWSSIGAVIAVALVGLFSGHDGPVPALWPYDTSRSVSTSTYYAVTDVVDGDTIKIDMAGATETVRMIGIDTPEIVDPEKPVQCFGAEASQEAKKLLTGREVRLETDSTQDERDEYGRLLAYVYRDDGLFYNEYMIKEGYAREYTFKGIPFEYESDFKAAQASAKKAQLGLWSPATCNGSTRLAS